MTNTRSKPIARPIRAVIFDMDGTLVTSHLNFKRIRAEAGVPDGTPILEYVEKVDSKIRDRVMQVLLAHEKRAAHECSLQQGAEELIGLLRKQGVKLALLTRNSRESVDLVLERFGLDFDCSIARDEAAPKPSPEPVLKIAGALGLRPAELLVVGDYVFDIQSGQAAGAYTALLDPNKTLKCDPPADIHLNSLSDLLPYFSQPA